MQDQSRDDHRKIPDDYRHEPDESGSDFATTHLPPAGNQKGQKCCGAWVECGGSGHALGGLDHRLSNLRIIGLDFPTGGTDSHGWKTATGLCKAFATINHLLLTVDTNQLTQLTTDHCLLITATDRRIVRQRTKMFEKTIQTKSKKCLWSQFRGFFYGIIVESKKWEGGTLMPDVRCGKW